MWQVPFQALSEQKQTWSQESGDTNQMITKPINKCHCDKSEEGESHSSNQKGTFEPVRREVRVGFLE
jgi:hypothetical protein